MGTPGAGAHMTDQTRLQDSHTEMTEVLLPNHANAFGRALGGVILRWMDICGVVAAMRFADGPCVTAAMDHVDFIAPIHEGEIVTLEGYVYETGRTSLEVIVDVEAERPGRTRDRRETTTSFFTFVAIDEDGQPRPVPDVACDSTEEQALRDRAINRRGEQREARRDNHR